MTVQSITKKGTSLDEQAVNAFSTQLHGELIQPGDEHYEDARKVYNAMIDIAPNTAAFNTDSFLVRVHANAAHFG